MFHLPFVETKLQLKIMCNYAIENHVLLCNWELCTIINKNSILLFTPICNECDRWTLMQSDKYSLCNHLLLWGPKKIVVDCLSSLYLFYCQTGFKYMDVTWLENRDSYIMFKVPLKLWALNQSLLQNIFSGLNHSNCIIFISNMDS